MKKNIRVLAVLMIVIMLLSIAVQAAPRVGEIVNYTLYTDISLYIDGKPIKSFNIDGYTAVRVEDLVYYGFDVIWDAEARTLTAGRTTKEAPPGAGPGAYIAPQYMVGRRDQRVYHTDIRCFLDYKEVPSYNIGGQTIIYVDDLAAIYADVYEWDPDARTLGIKLVEPWAIEVANMRHNPKSDLLSYGFTVSAQNETITNVTGDFVVVPKISFNERSVSFDLNSNISYYGDFFTEVIDGVNIGYGERVNEDTAERREALGKVLRVFINGEYVGGELAYHQGNGSVTYTFLLDKYISYNEETVFRIEVGLEE